MDIENLVKQVEALIDELDLVAKRKAELEAQLSGIRKALAIPVLAALGGDRKVRSDEQKRRMSEAQKQRWERARGLPPHVGDGAAGHGPIMDSDGNVVAEDFGQPLTAAE